MRAARATALMVAIGGITAGCSESSPTTPPPSNGARGDATADGFDVGDLVEMDSGFASDLGFGIDGGSAADSGALPNDAGFAEDAMIVAADAMVVADAGVMSLCPPPGPYGRDEGDTIPPVRLRDCDGNWHSLHDLCARKASWFFVYAGW